jgi:eukaryotic-like serine/threonine-protein kinase
MEEVSEPRILAGKYRLMHQLGRGGMGSVWHAYHLTLHCSVAVKLIHPEIARHPLFRERFTREARAAAALRGPHVVQVLDHGVDGDVPFIVMELLDGESLAERLKRAGPLSPEETARIIGQIGRAIARAHEAGIIHRDLKPDNVFLVRQEDEEVAKVLDFGIAKSLVASPPGHAEGLTTETGAAMGTRCYMSPEQAAGAKIVDFRTDIWALGVMAFESLLGVRPFDGPTLDAFFQAIYGQPPPIPSRLGAVPRGFDQWFARVCAHDMNPRFASAREACADLKRICDGCPPHGTGGPLFPGSLSSRWSSPRSLSPGSAPPTSSVSSSIAGVDTQIGSMASGLPRAPSAATPPGSRIRRRRVSIGIVGLGALALGGVAIVSRQHDRYQRSHAPTSPNQEPAAVVGAPATPAPPTAPAFPSPLASTAGGAGPLPDRQIAASHGLLPHPAATSAESTQRASKPQRAPSRPRRAPSRTTHDAPIKPAAVPQRGTPGVDLGI